MHVTELVDLAAIVAENSRQIIETSPRVILESLPVYWSASRCRLDRWGRVLRSATGANASHDDVPGAAYEAWEEIIAGEILSRITAAVFAAHDERYEQEEAAPVASNILYGHIDARRRAMRQVETLEARGVQAAIEYRGLFLHVQRWNDLLLARVPISRRWQETAFSVEIARDFAADTSLRSPSTGAVAADLMRTSLRLTFQPLTKSSGYSAALNTKIAAALIECFSPEMFDSLGLLKSVWLHRMESIAEDTVAMVEGLIDSDQGPSGWQR